MIRKDDRKGTSSLLSENIPKLASNKHLFPLLEEENTNIAQTDIEKERRIDFMSGCKSQYTQHSDGMIQSKNKEINVNICYERMLNAR